MTTDAQPMPDGHDFYYDTYGDPCYVRGDAAGRDRPGRGGGHYHRPAG